MYNLAKKKTIKKEHGKNLQIWHAGNTTQRRVLNIASAENI